MLSSTVLNRCIELLSQLNHVVGNNVAAQEALLELGYILRDEYNIVCKIEKEGESVKEYSDFSVKGLIADNKQLFKENETLFNDNVKLKSMVESVIPMVEKKIRVILEQLSSLKLET